MNKIKYIEHKNINKTLWDVTIDKSFNGIIFAYSWYLDIVSPEWDALILDDYKAVMPLTKRKKMGFNYLFQPFFNSQGGVFSIMKLDEKIVNKFLESIPKKFKLIEITLNTFNSPSSNLFDLTQIQTFEVDLINEYQTIRESYSQNIKRNIKKAEKNKVTAMKGFKPEPIIEIFKNNRGKNLSTYKEQDYFVLTRLMYELLHRNKAEIWSAYTEQNELCAGAFFIGSNNKAIFLFSGTTNLALKHGAMPFLIDQFIKENSLQNITLDFNGSNNENIARFYRGFGAKRCTFYFAKRNNLPWVLKTLKK